MPISNRMRWPIPSLNQDPWFDAFVALVNAQDASSLATLENDHTIVMGGGTFTFNSTTGLVTWDATIEITSPMTGFLHQIAAGNISVPDGQFLYCAVTRNLANNETLTLSVASARPIGTAMENFYLLGIRRGALLYLRNGSVLQNGVPSKPFEEGGGGGGGGGAGSIQITQSVLDTDPNLSTEGTVDWCAILVSSNPPQQTNTNTVHSKVTGGWIWDSFRWVNAGSTVTIDTPTSNSRSTNASDSLASTALVASTTVARMIGPTSGTNWGFVFRVPAPAGVQRVLKVRVAIVETEFEFIASLTDGVTTPSSVFVTTAPNPSNSMIITVTYTANTSCELVFRARNSINIAVGRSIRFCAATLA